MSPISIIGIAIIIGLSVLWTLMPAAGKNDPILEYINECKFQDAIKFAKKEIESKTLKPEKENLRILDIATCYHRNGNFKESMEYLDKFTMTKNRRDINSYAYGLRALNNIFMNKRLADARQDLLHTIEFDRFSKKPELYYSHYIAMAIAELALKDKDAAEALIEGTQRRIHSQVKYGANFSTYRMTGEYRMMQENCLMGLFFERMKMPDLAVRYYNRAMNYEYPNYYRNKAQEYLSQFTEEEIKKYSEDPQQQGLFQAIKQRRNERKEQKEQVAETEEQKEQVAETEEQKEQA